MVGERLREIARTLRFRLTAWNTALVLVVVISTLIGVHEGVRLTLVNEFDEMLREDLHEIRLSFKQSSPENRQKAFVQNGKWWADNRPMISERWSQWLLQKG